MIYLRGIFSFFCLFIFSISFAYSLDINPGRYTVYFGDINEDGFTDVYFQGKEQYVPIVGDITIPLILPPADSFALIRDTRLEIDY